MRSLSLLAAILLLPGSLPAQGRSPIAPPARTILRAPVEVELLPDAAGRPGVMVTINGRGPWRFAIDLGANALVVSDSVARILNLPAVRAEPGTVLTGAVEVASLQVGDARFDGMVAGVYPLPPGFNGVLGFNVFRDLLMTFDFPGRRFRLSQERLPTADGATILNLAAPDPGRLAYLNIPAGSKFGDDGVQPHLPFTIGSLRGSAVLDTQAGGYLYLPDSLMAAFAVGGDTSRLAGRGPTMGEMTLRRARVTDTMTLGHYTTVEPIVTFRDRPGPMVGMEFLGQFVLSFDQRSSRIRLERPARQIRIAPQPWETASAGAPAATPTNLADFVGTYGSRAVTRDGGTLYLQRTDTPGAPVLAMVPTGGDRFGLVRVSEAAIEFVRDGANVVAIRVRLPSGEWEQAARSGARRPEAAQGSARDTALVRRAAEDYINGFYAGDTTRMRRALHADLVKREASGRPGPLALQQVPDLVSLTTQMAGRARGVTTPADSIRVLDLFQDIALVRIGVPQWVDYLQVARVGEEWRIIHVLWQLRANPR